MATKPNSFQANFLKKEKEKEKKVKEIISQS
jgi:hypothetical protein